MGKRSAVVGFFSEVANTLLQAADPVNQDLHCAALAAVLQDSDAWQGSIQQQGSIHSLLQVRCFCCLYSCKAVACAMWRVVQTSCVCKVARGSCLWRAAGLGRQAQGHLRQLMFATMSGNC